MHDAGLLEAVDRPELEQPQRQVAVRAAAGPVDEVVHRAVHRLEAVLRPFKVDGREHALGEVRQVARGVEQPVLGDVRGADVVEPLLDVPPADVVLHLPLDDAALGVVDRQPRAQLVGEGVEVQLGAELAVVALLGLGQPLEVGLEVVLGRPGGAVDPLQLRVLLGAAPVGGGAASQLEGVADQLGGRQVRAAAEVLPRQVAVAAVVVVDGQLTAADLSVRPVGRVADRVALAALEADQLELVGLALQLVAGVLVGGDAAREGLALVDDALHHPLELLEVVRGERDLDVEVVVEPVADRRPDPEPGLGVHLLDRLGEDVRGGVPQDVEAVGAVDGDRFDDVPVVEHVGQVDELVADPRDDDAAVVREEVGRGRALRHRSLVSGDGHADLGRHGSTHSRMRLTARLAAVGKAIEAASAVATQFPARASRFQPEVWPSSERPDRSKLGTTSGWKRESSGVGQVALRDTQPGRHLGHGRLVHEALTNAFRHARGPTWGSRCSTGRPSR